MRRIPALFALLVLVAAVAAACGGGDDGGSGDVGTGLSPEESLTQAAQALGDAESFRLSFDGEVDVEGEALSVPLVSNLPSGQTALNGEGAVARPDRARFDVDVDVGPIALPATLVRVGDDLYLSAVGQNIQVDAAVEQVRQLDPGVLAETALGWVENPVEAGSESRDGVDTVRIEGTVDGDAVAADLGALLGPGALTDAVSDGTVEVWVGAEDLLPRRILVSYEATLGGGGAANGTLGLALDVDLFEYGADVVIEAPEGAQRLSLDDLPGLLGP